MEMIQQQKLEQQLIMTQEMKQSLEILQVPIAELRAIIDKELLENPLLEIERENSIPIESENKITPEEEYYRDADNYEDMRSYSNDDNDSNIDIISKLSVKEESVLERMKKDIKSEINEKKHICIAEYMIDGIDEKGFFKQEIQKIVENVNRLWKENVTEEDVQYIKNKIMNLETGGIGSKDISEYLLYQINNDENFNLKESAKKVLTECFDEFVRKKVRDIYKKTGIDEKSIKKIYEKVVLCNPYPLRGYDNVEKKSDMVNPEVIVKEEKGAYEIYLNDRDIPKIHLNNEYYKSLSKDKEALEYLKEKAMKVRSLERSIEQRKITLYRVSKAIVDKQKEFFQKGEKYIKPMVLAEIGYELGLHESTISRVVNNKYMETPRGVYELKFFFSGKVETKTGDSMSMLAVQEIIRDLINKEDKKKPYKDKEISEFLEKKGIKVSQRTIANYREAMDILPTYLRKEI